MSIEKFNPRVSNELIPFTQVNTHVIQNITDMQAGFVWVYLLSLPENWLVIKAHLKKHFDIGDDRIKRIFAYLRKANLIEYVRVRDDRGRLRTSEIKVLNGLNFTPQDTTGVKNLHVDKPPVDKPPSPLEKPNKISASTTGGKTTRVENHTCGEPGTTKEIDNKRNKKQKRNIGEEQIFPEWVDPKDWEDFRQHRKDIKQPLTQLAERKSLNVLTRLYHAGNNPKEVIDQTIANGWSGLFEVRKVKNQHTVVNTMPIQARTNETRSTVMEYGPGHPTWEANQRWNREHGKKGLQERDGDRDRGVRAVEEFIPQGRSMGCSISASSTRTYAVEERGAKVLSGKNHD